jgi:hypothetical protein
VSTVEQQAECSCDGNGWIDCWDCGGEGEVTVALDDLDDDVDACPTCDGNGGWPCPAHE